MRHRKRKLAVILAAALLALLVACGCGLYFIQTTSFQNRVRDEMIAALKNASGGQVELKAFHFDWRTFSARFTDLTIHGTEPLGAQPLLQIPLLRIDLKLRSLFLHEINVVRVNAERPKVNLLLRPDGSSNIPGPISRRSQAINTLFDLKVGHFDLNRGALQLNAARHAFSLRGDNLRALLQYQQDKAAYDLTVVVPQIGLSADCCSDLLLNFRSHAILGRDNVRIERLQAVYQGATLEASGTVSHLLQLAADFRFHAEGPGAVLASIGRLPELHDGALSIDGSGKYDAATGFTAHGNVDAHGLAVSSTRFSLKSADVTSRFSLGKNTLAFHDAVVQMLGGKITGDATFRGARLEQVSAFASAIDLRELVLAARKNPVLYSGSISGKIGRNDSSKYIAQLDILPGRGANPLSGRIELSGTSPADLLFGSSRLSSRTTQLNFNGSQRAGFNLVLTSSDLADFKSALAHLAPSAKFSDLPLIQQDGFARFAGTLTNLSTQPIITGTLSLTKFRWANRSWDCAQWVGSYSRETLSAASFALDAGIMRLNGTGHLGLKNWKLSANSTLVFSGTTKGVALSGIVPQIQGSLSATLDVSGTIDDPIAQARVTAENLRYAGLKFIRAGARAKLANHKLQFEEGRAEDASGGTLSFHGSYAHPKDTWQDGELSVALETHRLSFSNLSLGPNSAPDLSGRFDMAAQLAVQITPAGMHIENANGYLALQQFGVSGGPLGDLTAQLTTRGQTLSISLAGDLGGNNLTGKAGVELTPDNPVQGDLQFQRVPLSALQHLLSRAPAHALPIEGFVKGSVQFNGLLAQFNSWHSAIQLQQIQLGPQSFNLRNAEPVTIELSAGIASIPHFELLGPDTKVRVEGSIGYLQRRALNLKVNGSIGLGVLSLFEHTVESAGQSNVEASISGTVAAPVLSGRVEVQNGSISSRDTPNSLSQLNGLVTFDRDRATIQRLTAEYGGGRLSAGGFVSFGGNAPPAYHLDGHADQTRLRSSSGISMTANADFRLSGTSSSSLLSGGVTISRIVFNPNTDVGNVLSNFAASVPSPADQTGFLGSMQLDVLIQNAPSLQLSTSLSRDVEADVDLHLRGTPERPVLLGAVSVNQGDIRVFGSRYTINRGEVSFLNTAHIEPVLDLDLQTQTRGINVDITISGTLNRLNITYRSDPPLQPRDIIALLTVGRTPEQSSNVQSTQSNDVTSLQSSANSVLGQAISPQSSRLSKLFGITNIRIDPLVQGITNIRQSRLTLEQQISRNITITYVTNLEQTSEQIFRLEWAINRQYSVVAVRDDNGEFGIDLQFRKRFK